VHLFYPILDLATLSRLHLDSFQSAAELLEEGAKIVQFRYKGHFSRDIFRQAQEISELCRQAGATFVINDRADIARLLGSALHLGQDDLSPTAARLVTGPETLIGFSTHNESQLRATASEPADYLALGPIFGTSSKENPDPPVGLAELKRLRSLTDRPLVAIGGITRANAQAVIEAGADSVAVIGDLFSDGNLKACAKEWLQLLR
jgi:thiamine-phosphate pyrophosphorylase